MDVADYNSAGMSLLGSSTCIVQAQKEYKNDKGCGMWTAYAKCAEALPSCCKDRTKCEGLKEVLEDMRKRMVYKNQSECTTIAWPQGWPSCSAEGMTRSLGRSVPHVMGTAPCSGQCKEFSEYEEPASTRSVLNATRTSPYSSGHERPPHVCAVKLFAHCSRSPSSTTSI